jgi:hypothetical protein
MFADERSVAQGQQAAQVDDDLAHRARHAVQDHAVSDCKWLA